MVATVDMAMDTMAMDTVVAITEEGMPVDLDTTAVVVIGMVDTTAEVDAGIRPEIIMEVKAMDEAVVLETNTEDEDNPMSLDRMLSPLMLSLQLPGNTSQP